MTQGSETPMADGFAERLRVEIARLGWDQKTLADRLKVSQHTVGKWARGEALPQPETAEKLAALLGVDPGYLLFGSARLGASAAALGIFRDVLRQVETDPASLERMARMWTAFRTWRDQQDGGGPALGS